MSFLLRNAPQVLLSAEEIIKEFRDLVNRSFQREELDISYDQWIVISVISKKQGITQIQIAERTRKEPASISRILKLLEKKEIIEKVSAKGNKRAKRIYLTPKGDDTLRRATRLFNMIAKDGFKGVYDQEVNLFVRILDKVQQNFKND
ncbi:MAG: MarR family transcriptional regulator [Bacteroidota bacterium]